MSSTAGGGHTAGFCFAPAARRPGAPGSGCGAPPPPDVDGARRAARRHCARPPVATRRRRATSSAWSPRPRSPRRARPPTPVAGSVGRAQAAWLRRVIAAREVTGRARLPRTRLGSKRDAACSRAVQARHGSRSRRDSRGRDGTSRGIRHGAGRHRPSDTAERLAAAGRPAAAVDKLEKAREMPASCTSGWPLGARPLLGPEPAGAVAVVGGRRPSRRVAPQRRDGDPGRQAEAPAHRLPRRQASSCTSPPSSAPTACGARSTPATAPRPRGCTGSCRSKEGAPDQLLQGPPDQLPERRGSRAVRPRQAARYNPAAGGNRQPDRDPRRRAAKAGTGPTAAWPSPTRTWTGVFAASPSARPSPSWGPYERLSLERPRAAGGAAAASAAAGGA